MHYLQGEGLYLNYVTLKFRSTYRFLWGHELANSFRLLRLHNSFFTNDDEFFIQTKITFFVNVAIGFTALKNFPFYSKRLLGVLQIPNMFRQFCFISSLRVSKGSLMVSVTFLKVCRQSDVSFSCCLGGYCGLIDDISLKAFSFERAIRFLSAVAGVGLLRWCVC